MVEATAEKKGKDVFEGGARNEEGKYTEAPENFDFDTFKPLPKKDFESDEVYLDHQANVCRARAELYTAKADKCTRTAAKLRALGTPETRKKAMKLSKMRDQLASLEKSLEEDGVNLEALED